MDVTTALRSTHILHPGPHASTQLHRLYPPCQQLPVLADKRGCGVTPAVVQAGIHRLCSHHCMRPHKTQIWLHAHGRVKWHCWLLVNPCFGMLQGLLPGTDLSAHRNYKGDTVRWTQAGLLVTVTHGWDSSAASTPSQCWKDGKSTAFKHAQVNEWEQLRQNFQHKNVFQKEVSWRGYLLSRIPIPTFLQAGSVLTWLWSSMGISDHYLCAFKPKTYLLSPYPCA